MTILLIIIASIPGIILGKYIFKYHFNPISIYTIIWSGMLGLYSLKLIKYDNLNLETWLYVVGAYVSLIFGALTYYEFSKRRKKTDNDSRAKISLNNEIILKYSILFFSLLGFIAAFQHWNVLIQKYGNIATVLLKANEIYRLRVEGKLEGVIPYIHLFPYIGIFLVAIYSAYRKKVSFLIFLPFTAILLKEIANVGRSNILLAAVMFVSTYFIVKYFINTVEGKSDKNIIKTLLLVLLAFGFFIGTSVMMRAFRGTVESFTGTSRALRSFEDNLLISPSIYLYLSSHVVVFDKYLEMDVEHSKFAQYSFQPIYNILAKFDIVDKTDYYHKGYFIPVWTNTGTYLREMHADYGIWGILLVPYLLGIFITYLWFNYFNTGKLFYLILLVQFMAIIFFSFFLSVTRFGSWYLNLFLLLIFVPLLDKIVNRFSTSSIVSIEDKS